MRPITWGPVHIICSIFQWDQRAWIFIFSAVLRKVLHRVQRDTKTHFFCPVIQSLGL